MFICICSLRRLVPSLGVIITPKGTTPNRYLKAIIYTAVYITTSLNRPSLVSCRLNEGLERSIRNKSEFLPLSKDEEEEEADKEQDSGGGKSEYRMIKTIQTVVMQGGRRIGQAMSPFSRKKGARSIVDNRYVACNHILILQTAHILTYYCIPSVVKMPCSRSTSGTSLKRLQDRGKLITIHISEKIYAYIHTYIYILTHLHAYTHAHILSVLILYPGLFVQAWRCFDPR